MVSILSGLGFGVHGTGRRDIHDAHRYLIARVECCILWRISSLFGVSV